MIDITEKHATGLKLRRGLAVSLAVLVAAAALPVFASAQVGPTNAQYDDSLTQVGTGVGPGDPSDPSDPSEASGRPVDPLPFTGLDITLLVIVAALVGGTGFVLRRASRSAGETG